MPIPSGTFLGSYEVLTQIGAGGMGEVYKARDPKLDRLVAIKVLPPGLAASGDLLARFQREAKAVAALNHPNILGIYDFGTQGEHTYAVMELLEGETLRDKLRAGPLPPKRAIELAQQIAEGLAAAHAKGIIHRDLKPDNLFLTRSGQMKVLDFGLAKQLPAWIQGQGAGSDRPTEAISLGSGGETQAGLVMGTAGYMSPEQVRGDAVDARSDIFAFGVVLYEMLSGRRAFSGETGVDTLRAILKEDPLDLTGARVPIPPALERLVFHCLEKNPENRFQSFKDLSYALSNLSNLSILPAMGAASPKGRGPRAPWPAMALAATLVTGLLLGGLDRLHLGLPAAPPTFQRLCFEPGTITAARFGPDGQTVYFSQRRSGGPAELFVINPGSLEPKSLNLPDTQLLDVSPTGELAVLLHPKLHSGAALRGLLAQVPSGGGAARPLLEDVTGAIWDGPGLATLQMNDADAFHLEWPVGHPLVDGTSTSRGVSHLRTAPGAAYLALVDSDTIARSQVVVYDRAGRRRVLFTKEGDGLATTLTGLAWAPGGELWCSETQGGQTALWALTLGGKRRLLFRSAGTQALMDVSADGRALLVTHQARLSAFVQVTGSPFPRDLSVRDGSQPRGLTSDGRALLLVESSSIDGGTADADTYLRNLDASAPLKVARGTAQSLSRDGAWVQLEIDALQAQALDPAQSAALRQAGLDPDRVLDPRSHQPYILFVPTGLGRPFALNVGALKNLGCCYLHPDGRRVMALAVDGTGEHWFLLDRNGGAPVRLTADGQATNLAGFEPIAPDGSRFVTTGDMKSWFVLPMAGGPATAIRGLAAGDRIIGWSADNRGVYLRSSAEQLPVTLTRLDLASGARTKVMDLRPPDPAGFLQLRNIYLAPDGRTAAFGLQRQLSELYQVNGL